MKRKYFVYTLVLISRLVKGFSMKANRILSFTHFTLNIVLGKPGRGGAPASWLIGPPVVDLTPIGCTSCSVANLAIWTPTRTLCVLHQSTWLFAQPLTPARRVRCMCVVAGWAVLAWSARVVASLSVVSNDGWTEGKKPTTSWGWFLSNHFFTDLAQHFFPVATIASWASDAFPRCGL